MTETGSWNERIIEEFRASGGKVGGQFEGAPLLLLTTTGAKSGRAQTSPVMYLRDGDRVVVFASYAGNPRNPSWYHNLVAHPRVVVELGEETFPAIATVTGGAERDALFARQAALYPGFNEYQEKTSRVIPVVALERAGGDH
ncbi:nitroreductase family deazaflavin-dependent oxidoreductase [Frankia sp. Cr2]|uniref:nitroreductase family deazaflavin-dependent oxidoreductase n=1 Tax=Frankia sp. Cr2 TaxID=3073932 RepID=UPI002AD2F713|nr:nitroreductase family deazaflavin-dependent oxidoreductase [Frankia sp. Cr2]